MPKIELDQGSEEWKSWRRSKITATDAGIIIGTNPFKTTKELWEEKLGIREPQVLNDVMRRGQELEEEARALFIQTTGIKMDPVVYESEEYSWAGASLDGLSECKKMILEIKCPGQRAHQENVNGIVKEYYITQIQHQLMVLDADMCFFVSYRPEHETKIHIKELFPIKEYIRHMLEKEKEFWIQLCTMCPPPEPWQFQEKL